uniref:Glycosyl transferase family 2 n=1 Tax=Nitratidesulfovibrio vulgaris (strain DSM 19637 / Miyazaki F) TaxID=883 RepID=B8DIY2_NITV9
MGSVTIVIPCRNDGKFLQGAVDSALAQTHGDLEIIIVDDGSDDVATLRLLGALQEQGLTVLRGEGRGPAAARNMAIAMARGDYVLPLDADDWLAPEYAEKASKILDANPMVGVCYCDVQNFGLKRGKLQFAPYSQERLLLGEVLITVSSMFRKVDWVAVGGFDEVLPGLEDYDFWISLAERGVDFFKIGETLFFCRVRGGSRTARMFMEGKERDSLLYIFKKHRKIYEQYGEAVFLRYLDLNAERHQRECLFLWRFLSIMLNVERRARFLIKRLLKRC